MRGSVHVLNAEMIDARRKHVEERASKTKVENHEGTKTRSGPVFGTASCLRVFVVLTDLGLGLLDDQGLGLIRRQVHAPRASAAAERTSRLVAPATTFSRVCTPG